MRDIDDDAPVYGPHFAPGSDADADDAGYLPLPAPPAPAPVVDLSGVAFAVFFGNGDTGVVVMKKDLAVAALIGSTLIPGVSSIYMNVFGAMVTLVTDCVSAAAAVLLI